MKFIDSLEFEDAHSKCSLIFFIDILYRTKHNALEANTAIRTDLWPEFLSLLQVLTW